MMKNIAEFDNLTHKIFDFDENLVPFPAYPFPFGQIGYPSPFFLQMVVPPPVNETKSTTLDDPSMAEPVTISAQTVSRPEADALATANEKVNSGSETEDEETTAPTQKKRLLQARTATEKSVLGSYTEDDPIVVSI